MTTRRDVDEQLRLESVAENAMFGFGEMAKRASGIAQENDGTPLGDAAREVSDFAARRSENARRELHSLHQDWFSGAAMLPSTEIQPAA
jgi:hypothetical protein